MIFIPNQILFRWLNQLWWGRRDVWNIHEKMEMHGFGGEKWRKETNWWHKHRWENNIYLKEIAWESMTSIYVAQGRGRWWGHVNRLVQHWMLSRAVNYLTSCRTGSFSKGLFCMEFTSIDVLYNISSLIHITTRRLAFWTWDLTCFFLIVSRNMPILACDHMPLQCKKHNFFTA